MVFLFGGEGEIRTLERFYPLHDFQSCALDQLSDFSVLLTSRSIALDYYITANPQCQHKNSIVLLNNFAFSGIYFYLFPYNIENCTFEVLILLPDEPYKRFAVITMYAAVAVAVVYIFFNFL